jgi:hypothetical protein
VRAADRPRDDVLQPAERGAAITGRSALKLAETKAVALLDRVAAPRAADRIPWRVRACSSR